TESREWYVVEVELAWHDRTHITEQLEILGDGIYDRTLIDSLTQAIPQISAAAARTLLEVRPSFVCIVNEFTETIQAICRASPFELVVAEPYRAENGEYAFVITQAPGRLRTPALVAGTFVLRRGSNIGDSEFAMLPSGFPAWAGPVDLELPDQTIVRT